MTDEKPPHDADVDNLTAELDAALKACRTMVTDYRSMIANDRTLLSAADSGPPENEPADY